MTERPQTDAGTLHRLFQLADDDAPHWGADELAAIWRHQLAAPIELDLTQFGGVAPASLASPGGEGPSVRTFGELLHHPQPPIALLQATKQFAKACRNRGDGALPDEIATMLYLLTIVAAASRAGQRISGMDNAALRHALDWAAQQEWTDPPTRELIAEGRRLASADSSDEPQA